MKCGKCYQRGNGARFLWVGRGGSLVSTSWCGSTLQLHELSRLCCCVKPWCAHSSCSQEHRPAWTTQHVPSISNNHRNSTWFLKSTFNSVFAFSVCALLVILSSINGWGCCLCNCRNNILCLDDFFGYLATSFEHI